MSDLNDKNFKFDLQLFAEGDPPGDPPAEPDDGFPPWMAVLPDEYKKDEYGKGYKSVGEFYKTHKGLRAKLDAMPKPPGKASEYELIAPPEDSGIKVNPETEKWFRKTIFGLKMSKEMAGKLYTSYNEMIAGQLKATTKKETEDLTKADELMHGEWGEDFDKNMKLVEKGITDAGGEDLRKLLDDTGLGNHPVILKTFRQIGFEHSEDTLKEGVVMGGTKKEGIDLNEEYKTMKDLPPDRE